MCRAGCSPRRRSCCYTRGGREISEKNRRRRSVDYYSVSDADAEPAVESCGFRRRGGVDEAKSEEVGPNDGPPSPVREDGGRRKRSRAERCQATGEAEAGEAHLQV
uniref:Uncharacterized protein n=1 Tax=Oryza barthii TaxID=65489 RepID=A0A0D3FKM9_9ORYZ